MTKELTIQKQVPALVEAASAMVAIITDEPTKEAASELLSRLNRTHDDLLAEKDKTMRPALDTVAAIRKQYAPFEKPLEAAITALRSGLSTYQTKAKLTAKLEAEKIAERIGEGRGHLTMETAVKKIENIETPREKTETESGTLKFRTQQNFRIVDLTKIPPDYLLPNESAIRRAMKDGIQLAGIEYFTEEVPVNFR